MTQPGSGYNDPLELPTDPKEIVDAMFQRCAQLKPGLTRGEFESTLSSARLPMGKTLYVFRRGDALVMADNVPGGGDDQPESPDLTPMDTYCRTWPPGSAGFAAVARRYENGLQCNAKGDAGFDDAPWSWSDDPGPYGEGHPCVIIWDYCSWRAGSGATRCLGQVRFSNIAGSGNYMCPN